MDIFHKADDLNIITGNISFNPARSFREKLINEEIFIDFIEMFTLSQNNYLYNRFNNKNWTFSKPHFNN